MHNLAAFTISRNESVFLPLWLRYYAKAKATLFVLDHESDDGSADPGPVPFTRVPVVRENYEDVSWMRAVVETKLAELLNDYECVVFAEVDEFLVPRPSLFAGLADYIDCRRDFTHATATGYDVCQIPESPPFGGKAPPFLRRGWKRNDRYDKTLVCREPVRWELGFHRPLPEFRRPDPDPSLFLLHLHYADREVAWNRLASRRRGKAEVPGEGGFGFQNKIADRATFDRHFAEAVAGAEPLPAWAEGVL